MFDSDAKNITKLYISRLKNSISEKNINYNVFGFFNYMIGRLRCPESNKKETGDSD